MSYALRDSSTMLRRYLLHMRRYPVMTFMVIMIPAVFLLLFVFVLGGTLGAGLGGDRSAYANYVAPGILLLAIAGAGQGTAISVAMDMSEGIIARFKTMAIFRPSVLTGHVLGSVVQTVVGLAIVVAIAIGVGFRPTATPVEWLAATGVLAMVSFAVIWVCLALGLVTKSVEAASNLPMPLLLLPFLGSGFVPTDSMPTAVRLFAQYQPFTPVMETLRGLLLGTAIGNNGILAVAWCAAMTVGGFVWSVKLYNRDPRP
jgi:ABC-2 type transport system permease protein